MAGYRRAHVFVVDSDSYPVHRDRMFCGVKNPDKYSKRKSRSGKWSQTLNTARYGLYADMKAIRKGDLVFFYQMRIDEGKYDRGFRGIFEATSEPFFDDSDIDGVIGSTGGLGSAGKKVAGKCAGCGSPLSEVQDAEGNSVCRKCGTKQEWHILPNRILIKALKLFENTEGSEAVIDDNTAYIDRNYIKKNLPVLWTMLFRKTSGAGRARSITHILPEEAFKLQFLFEDLFTEAKINGKTIVPYYKPAAAQPIETPLDCDGEGELDIEALLEAWFMENLDKDITVLKDVIGNPADLEYFGNNVLYGVGGEKVDVLCIHKRGEERYKATVIELKKGEIGDDAVSQINDYTKWMSQLVFGDDVDTSKRKIQPVLIGHSITDKVRKLAEGTIKETQKPIVLLYNIKDNNITFRRVL